MTTLSFGSKDQLTHDDSITHDPSESNTVPSASYGKSSFDAAIQELVGIAALKNVRAKLERLGNKKYLDDFDQSIKSLEIGSRI